MLQPSEKTLAAPPKIKHNCRMTHNITLGVCSEHVRAGTQTGIRTPTFTPARSHRPAGGRAGERLAARPCAEVLFGPGKEVLGDARTRMSLQAPRDAKYARCTRTDSGMAALPQEALSGRTCRDRGRPAAAGHRCERGRARVGGSRGQGLGPETRGSSGGGWW